MGVRQANNILCEQLIVNWEAQWHVGVVGYKTLKKHAVDQAWHLKTNRKSNITQ